MNKFHIHAPYRPSGDQPKAIESLVFGLQKGYQKQTLLGVTGSGKTFTVANVIEQVQLPTLVIAHNKTLAAQLCNEFREFFPNNAVEYFVSYYDYYQPEAYMPHTDTYIEKEAQINEEIDRLRHACTQALLTRRDVIIVASVSAIYGLGSPKEYEKIVLHLTRGQEMDRRGMMDQLVEMQFERTNADLTRGTFRMRGQVFEIMPANEERIYRFEVGKYIERIELVDPVKRTVIRELPDTWFFPAKHYVASPEMRERAFTSIKQELAEQLAYFEKKGNVLEHERLKRRVNYDLEMIKNIGYCNGIENYSRHFDGRDPGEAAFTLLDYFRFGAKDNRIKDEKIENRNWKLGNREIGKPVRPGHPGGLGNFLTVIDESHVTVPQLHGMYAGDKARKDTLVEHGFRLPSARDNRPLMFEEFEARTEQTLYVSATPSEYEIKNSQQVVEQIVRPTGLIDPEVLVRPVTGNPSSPRPTRLRRASKETGNPKPVRPGHPGGLEIVESYSASTLSQVEDLLLRIEDRVKKGERVLVTTLTKKMAEDLTEYVEKKKIKVKYLHSDIDTLERIEIITDLRRGVIDVIIGVNLLREGLDMPEVSLVAILDADKEGFLRSETSLIQTIGRAARNVNGQVVLYADSITGSMERAIGETNRRREIQLAYNKAHGITPKTIEKAIKNLLEEFGIDTKKPTSAPPSYGGRGKKAKKLRKTNTVDLDLLGDARPMKEIIKDKEARMKEAAQKLEFELAAILRDEIRELVARQKVK